MFFIALNVGFRTKKGYLQGILLHYFIQKKSAADTYRILVETYSKHALSETTSKDSFRRFKNKDFDVKDEKKKKTLWRAELMSGTKSWGVDHTTVSKCLKALGMIQRQGHWVLYELKLRDVERGLVMCEQLLQRQKRKVFLHRIVTSNEKWLYNDNSMCWRSLGKPGHASTSPAKSNISSAFGEISWL